VTATYGARQRPPLDAIRSWIDESYRAIAPKRFVAELDAAAAGAPKKRATAPARARRRARP
jgi:hypothetical protein